MTSPDELEPTLESLKLALGRMERATSRVEVALRKGGSGLTDGMTSSERKTLESGLQSAIHRIDALLKDDKHG